MRMWLTEARRVARFFQATRAEVIADVNLLALASEEQKARWKKYGEPKVFPEQGAYYVSEGLRVVCLHCNKRFDAGGFPNHIASQKCFETELRRRVEHDVVQKHYDEVRDLLEGRGG
jgi:hypothetical protein